MDKVDEGKMEMQGQKYLENGQEESSGIFVGLAMLPEEALLTEEALARFFRRSPKSIRRMEIRGDIPRSIRVGGRKCWIAGRVKAYLNDRAKEVEKEGRDLILKIKNSSPKNIASK